MVNRGQLYLGAGLVLLGIIFLLGTVFQIDLGPLCWSVGLILLGVWLVMRPKFAAPGSGTEVVLIGDLKRRGSWSVHDEEFWLGVSDVDIDMTQAVIPPGLVTLRFYSFVSDVDIFVPRTVGVSVHAAGFVVDSDLLGREQDAFLSPVEAISDDFHTAESRLRIEMTGFVAKLNVRRM